ncbi:MAG: hypothetical protein G01um101416_19 [Microgenomates group bacterium Gr01-1014_16]|nr:MAG: hypothetical protein G01um101416_19 [Microgenomates group bacterium Gr01-1014_16]
MQKKIIVGTVVLVLILGGFFLFRKPTTNNQQPTTTPIPGIAEQLTPDQYPKARLDFSSDAHYVTVNITNIKSDQLEYNLIYDATVKGNKIQTGVNASAKLDGQTDYSYKQLLGSESSGKFTYHTKIDNAVMELALRDSAGRSVYNATLPFTVSPGTSINL